MIEPRSSVKLGVLLTHTKFVGGLIPDDQGRWPREPDGQLTLLKRLADLVERSPMPFEVAQVSYFTGVARQDIDELVRGIRALGLEPHFVLMVGGGDPMDPADEEAFVAALVEALAAAKEHNISSVSSTSLEMWMQEGAHRKQAADFEAAVQQLVHVHTRAFQEAQLADSCVQAWHIEFLREGEFKTFTDLGTVWEVLRAANERVGRPFYKALVDAAHCGDSSFTIDENRQLIETIAAADALGIFHASAKTTRGCLSTDDGWVAAMLEACARTGKLEYALVEVFHHEDEALAGLRALDPGHGIDTRDGRSYDEVVIDGLVDVGRRLNNLCARGLLSPRAGAKTKS